MKNPLHILLLSLWAFTLCSCRDDDGPYADEFVSYDIVVLTRQVEKEGSRFALYRPDSDEPVTLTAPTQYLDLDKVPVGDRLLLGYTPKEKPYVSGEIYINGYSAIANDTLRVYDAGVIDRSQWDREPIYVQSIWRAGNYLNVHGKLTYTDEAAVLRLGVDEEELKASPAFPQLYLIYQMRYPADNFSREFYASFDISELWESDLLEGFTVNVNNSNLKQNQFTFTK